MSIFIKKNNPYRRGGFPYRLVLMLQRYSHLLRACIRLNSRRLLLPDDNAQCIVRLHWTTRARETTLHHFAATRAVCW